MTLSRQGYPHPYSGWKFSIFMVLRVSGLGKVLCAKELPAESYQQRTYDGYR
jgi:hypothetical protein